MDIDATDTSTTKPLADDIDTTDTTDTSTSASSISAPDDFDLDAINEAVAESEKTTPPIQNSFDVDDISLDNTPTSDAELEKQVADNPSVSLANGTPLKTADSDVPAEPKHDDDSGAAFVDGDIIDETSSSDEPKEPNPYENIGKDPLAEDTTPAPAAAAPAAEEPAAEKPAEASAPLEPVSLENAITTGPIKGGNKKVIIGVVCGVVLVGIIVALILVLKN